MNGFTDMGITFTDAEIEALVKIANAQQSTRFPVDMRKMTRKVRDYIKTYQLVKCEDGRWYPCNIDYVYSLDVRIVWGLVEKMIPAEGIGYSIIKDERWQKLDITPSGSKYHESRDLEAIERILARLAWFGYITFYSAGSVWRVDRVTTGE